VENKIIRLINNGPFELSSLLSTKAQWTSRSQVITWAGPRRRLGERRLGRQSGSLPTSRRISVGRTLILFILFIFDGCLVSTTRMICGRYCWFIFEILVNAILELGDRLANNQENLVDVCICGVLERIEPR
jgi:hypothetical protein